MEERSAEKGRKEERKKERKEGRRKAEFHVLERAANPHQPAKWAELQYLCVTTQKSASRPSQTLSTSHFAFRMNRSTARQQRSLCLPLRWGACFFSKRTVLLCASFATSATSFGHLALSLSSAPSMSFPCRSRPMPSQISVGA